MVPSPAVDETAGDGTGAPSHADEGWESLDWDQAEKVVRRYQARIAKAVQEGKWGKVKALQHLLTHSGSAKRLAVKRVTENQGKNTPGVDGTTWTTSAQKMAAVGALRRWGYRPLPLRRVYIPKHSGTLRPLGIPTLHDRAMQALCALALEPIAETTGDPNSYGFRPARSAADAIERCFRLLCGKRGAPWVLEGDIAACFDTIDHDWLLAHIPLERAILRAWLKAGFLERHTWYPTEAGTPQGGIISPLLANLALDGLEAAVSQPCSHPQCGTLHPPVHLVRYADDFVVTGASREVLADHVLPLAERFFAARGLRLSLPKTLITPIAAGFDFLGQTIRKFGDTLIIRPSQRSVTALLGAVRDYLKTHAQATTETVIGFLAPRLQGWANYHRHVCSTRTFSSVDSAVFRSLWSWARRRHPGKSAHWVAGRYFRSQGTRRWVFSADVRVSDGSRHTVQLPLLADVPIRRHVKVRALANPFDPAWDGYFEERLGHRLASTPQDRRALLTRLNEQHGHCPVCQKPITKRSGWRLHHLRGFSRGGRDRATNRVLVHPDCHPTVHATWWTAVRPRPLTGAFGEA